MIILLTGSTGYIAQRLLALLLKRGDEEVCFVGDKKSMKLPGNSWQRTEALAPYPIDLSGQLLFLLLQKICPCSIKRVPCLNNVCKTRRKL